MLPLKYLNAYSPDLQHQARQLMAEKRLGDYLQRKYPQQHDVQNDKALYRYTQTLKEAHLRNAPVLDKVIYDSKLDVVHHALGVHTAISRVQGGKLQAKKEIRIATLFKETPPEFLRMIVVHELAHLKELDHNKAFYQLCEYMQPGYHQLEFDLRLFLTWRDEKNRGDIC
jgi:predicted metal-dependent hydrolase